MKRSNDFLVGVVVLGAAVLLTGATLWLGQARLGDRRERVYARVRNVGNAKVGNAVVIRGVESGRIDAIELDEDGWVRVRMALDRDVRMPRDPVVILNESSMFGEWQATIMERAAAPANREVQQQLADLGAVKDGAIPGATLPDIAQLTAVAGRIAGDVASVAERVQVAFDDHAARELRASIRDFSQLSAELARTVRAQSANLDRLSADVHTTVTSVNATASALQRTASRVDSSTAEGQVSELVGNLTAASADIRDASAQLKHTSRALDRTQAQLDLVLAHTDSVMTKINTGQGSLGLLVNDPGLYRGSDSLVRQMRELVTDVKAHPRRYLSVKVF
jgi:phospholipid/cholesterol/gamma-HCH transport system substrate-binding protein